MRRYSLLLLISVLCLALLVGGCDSGGSSSGGSEEEPDPEPTTLQFSEASASAVEADTVVSIGVEISNPSDQAVRVDVVFDGEASGASSSDLGDFTSETVTFAASASDGSTQDITIPLTDDDEVEEAEEAVFSLEDPTGGAEVEAPDGFTLTIEDNDVGGTPPEITGLDCPAELEVGEEGAFAATINEEEATPPITNYWTFGDEDEASGLEVDKSYEEAGSYTATFSTSNDAGEESQDCTVEVSEVPSSSGTIYVDTDATGADDGTSWTDAFTHLQDALRIAEPGASIWVAEGTYYPDQGQEQTEGDRGASFVIGEDVGVAGGFAGGETDFQERDIDANPTILSGDIGLEDLTADNSYHVVRGHGTSDLLQGFIVTGGNADGSEANARGGGMYKTTRFVVDVTFVNNRADEFGGAIFNPQGRGRIARCTFENNSVPRNLSYEGAGIYQFKGSLLITESVFREHDNNAIFINQGDLTTDRVIFANNDDSAIDNDFGNLTIRNSSFFGNESHTRGGGSALRTRGGAATIVSSVFSGNSYGGFAATTIYSNGSNMKIVNSSFSQNFIDGRGDGGAVIVTTGAGGGITEIYNSILWGNEGSPMTGENNYVAHSIVEGGVPEASTDGGNNLDMDPRFADPDGQDNTAGTLDDVLRLLEGSPAINAGSNEFLDLDEDGDTADDVELDRAGEPRIQGGTVEMGAYEISQ